MAGTNALLRLGAAPLLGAADLLEALGLEAAAASPPVDGDEALALSRPAKDRRDEIARATGLAAGAVAAALTALELAGRVSSNGGVYRSTIGA